MDDWLRETSFCTNIMGRSWPNSHREKLLSFLAEDRHYGPQFTTLQEVWMQNPSGPHLFFGFYSWKNHWHFQGHIIKWKSVYLRAICWNDWLNSWLGLFCKQDTATCAHKLKRHSLAAPNSSLSQGILWHERGTTKYCICLSKMERSWEFKRKFSCRLVLFKTWIRIKISGRQI